MIKIIKLHLRNLDNKHLKKEERELEIAKMHTYRSDGVVLQ